MVVIDAVSLFVPVFPGFVRVRIGEVFVAMSNEDAQKHAEAALATAQAKLVYVLVCLNRGDAWGHQFFRGWIIDRMFHSRMFDLFALCMFKIRVLVGPRWEPFWRRWVRSRSC